MIEWVNRIFKKEEEPKKIEPKERKDHSLRQKVVVLTGAGISAESGLATFRDNNGLWKQHDAKKLASVAGFEENPQAVLDFYNYRRKQLLEVEPNHAHKMLAEL